MSVYIIKSDELVTSNDCKRVKIYEDSDITTFRFLLSIQFQNISAICNNPIRWKLSLNVSYDTGIKKRQNYR